MQLKETVTIPTCGQDGWRDMQKHTLLLKDINTFPLRCTAYLDPGIQTIKKTNYTIVAKRKGQKDSIS